MFRRQLAPALLVSAILLLFGAWTVFAQVGDSDSDSGGSAYPAGLGSDSNPVGAPEVIVPERLRVAGGTVENQEASVLYFAPQDEDRSTTVMAFYNTSSVTGTVRIETFNLTGGSVISTSFQVPPGHLVRAAADTVEPVGTWDETLLVNFRTFSTYGRLTMSKGIKADGYIAWNGGTQYDPMEAVPVLPLRFSSDPPSIFLPDVSR